MRGQERLRLYSLAELPIPYSAVIRCIPVRRACCCYCCSRWRNRGEKERERERERERDTRAASGTRTAGIFVWGYNAHVTYATLSPSPSLPLYIRLSLSVARAQLEHNVPSQWPVNRDRSSTVSLSFDRSSHRRTRDHPLPFFFPRKPLSSSSPLADTLSTTFPWLAMQVSARPCV